MKCHAVNEIFGSNTLCSVKGIENVLVLMMSLGGHRLWETGAVSVGGEWESETEPDCYSRSPAAAYHHPLPVQHHAHQGEAQWHCWKLTDSLPRPLLVSAKDTFFNVYRFICSARRTRTSGAECSSWRCPYNSVLNSCHTWSDRANRASGGEERSWGSERTEWGSFSWSWTEREARSRQWR